MAVPVTGTGTRSCGIIHSVVRLSKLTNLKPAKSITIKLDPFHENSASLRLFSYHINNKKVRLTNPSCRIRTEVISSQNEDPRVEVKLNNGGSILMLCHHFNVAEIFQQIVTHVSSLVPPPPPPSTHTATTVKKK